MFLHGLEVVLESRRTAIALQQAAEAPELVRELRSAVGRALLKVVDTVERVVVEARLPERSLDALVLCERLLTKPSQQPCVVLIPESSHAVVAARNAHQVKADLGEDVDVVRRIE